jgi:putative transcriptional regulator
MTIIMNLDVMLAMRKVRSKELAEFVGITEQNLSLIKTGKIRGFRLSTLDSICNFLDCQPGDILKYEKQNDEMKSK